MKLLFVLILAFASTTASNSAQVLDDEGLRLAFAEQTHIGAYRQYIKQYGAIQFFETYHRDGTLSYEANGVTSTGTWRVFNNKICFDYDNQDFLPGCFVVTAAGGCYYSYSEIDVGVAPVPGEDPWWIRSYIEGTSPDCARSELVS